MRARVLVAASRQFRLYRAKGGDLVEEFRGLHLIAQLSERPSERQPLGAGDLGLRDDVADRLLLQSSRPRHRQLHRGWPNRIGQDGIPVLYRRADAAHRAASEARLRRQGSRRRNLHSRARRPVRNAGAGRADRLQSAVASRHRPEPRISLPAFRLHAPTGQWRRPVGFRGAGYPQCDRGRSVSRPRGTNTEGVLDAAARPDPRRRGRSAGASGELDASRPTRLALQQRGGPVLDLERVRLRYDARTRRSGHPHRCADVHLPPHRGIAHRRSRDDLPR